MFGVWSAIYHLLLCDLLISYMLGRIEPYTVERLIDWAKYVEYFANSTLTSVYEQHRIDIECRCMR